MRPSRAACCSPRAPPCPATSAACNARGLPAERIGELTSEHSLVLYELTPRTASLEDAFMRLTDDAVEYRTTTLRELEPAA